MPADLQAALVEVDQVAHSPTRTGFPVDVPAAPSFGEIDVAEAARRLGVTPRALQARCARCSLKARKVGKRTCLVRWPAEIQEESRDEA